MSLVDKLNEKRDTIGIIGLGQVRLTIALRYYELESKTFGFDVDQKKVDKLQTKEPYINHINPPGIINTISKGD